MFSLKDINILSTCKRLVVKRWKFSQEKSKVVPNGKGLAKRYKFNQEELEVMPKGIGLAKKN
jgi:hypothetical protein